MIKIRILILILTALLAVAVSAREKADPPRVFSVDVATRAPSETNRMVKIWYRVPKGYDHSLPREWRVLVYFGGRNCSGKKEASGIRGWGRWADANGIFLACPGFRDDAYWKPQSWSGKALFDGLAKIRQKYRICDRKVLYYGYSAGAQCSNLFAAWKPERTRGWVSHACGVFHEPKASLRNILGVVTCGDADAYRYILGRRFVERYKRMGAVIIWRSLPNIPHILTGRSVRLARAALSYCDRQYADDLTRGSASLRLPERPVCPYAGDDAETCFYPSDSVEASHIPQEDKVGLPSREIAEAWGNPGRFDPK